jgi:hypothetical protein
MTTCTDIITLALSKLGVAGGLKAPGEVDLNLGLTTLQSYYRQLISSGKLGRVRPVSPIGDHIAGENERIFRASDFRGVIDLPTFIVEAWHGGDFRICHYDHHPADRTMPRPPRDGAFVIINDARSGNSEDYIYDGYVNQWVGIHDLNLGHGENVTDANGNIIDVVPPSVPPLANRDANGLAALLAVKLADHYGQTPSALTLRDANAWEAALLNGFGDPVDTLRPSYF